jgi:hypothetical protein
LAKVDWGKCQLKSKRTVAHSSWLSRGSRPNTTSGTTASPGRG